MGARRHATVDPLCQFGVWSFGLGDGPAAPPLHGGNQWTRFVQTRRVAKVDPFSHLLARSGAARLYRDPRRQPGMGLSHRWQRLVDGEALLFRMAAARGGGAFRTL